MTNCVKFSSPFLVGLSLKPQNIFLLIAFIWGILTVFLTPPFQVADEPNHFYRAVQIASGTFYPETKNNQVGGTIPVSVINTCTMFTDIPFHPERKIKYAKILSAIDIPLNPEIKTFVRFPHTSTYAPILYVPQSFAIFMGKLFDAPPLVLFYLGRLLNLCCWIVLIFTAIKITPIYKWLFMLLALTPMSVFQASSLSADAPTNGVAFLFIALIFNLAFNKAKFLTTYNLCFLMVLLVFLALSRYAYCFLFLLYFLIPVKKAGNLRNYILGALILFVITTVALSIGGYFVKHIFESVDPRVSFYGTPEKNINPGLQVQFIVAHFGLYIKSLVLTIWANGFFVNTFIGNLGWLDTPLPGLYILAALVTIFFAALSDGNKDVFIPGKSKMILFASFASVFLSLSTLLYLSWTSVGDPIILGFQGRYFIPVVPFGIALFYNRKLILPETTKCIFAIIFIVVSFLVMNHSLISRYYAWFC